MKLGFLYAGQGSQHPGMGADLYEKSPAFRKAFDSLKADFDLKKMCFDGCGGLIDKTRYTQPCLVAFAVGMTEVLKERGIVPSVSAGLSLGEYSALYSAGVFDAKTAVELVSFRGKAMEEAADGVESSMMAVLGLDREPLKKACEEAADMGVVVIANYNCPGQLVIGGEKDAVKKASELAKAAGAKRCLPLRVSGPFHTPLLKKAAEALEKRFRKVSFDEPKIPVIFNSLGDVKGNNITVKDLLVKQVCTSVYMEDSIRKMAGMGVDAIVEIGPGNALTGFTRKTAPNVPCFAVETVEDVEKLVESLKKLEKERAA